MACFELTDWLIFRRWASSLDEYTATVIDYIRFCVELCIPARITRLYPNEKPWINSDIRQRLKERTIAFRSGDGEHYKRARYELRSAIKAAKRRYRDRLEQDYSSHDSRRMWKGLRVITDYKTKLGTITHSPASLPDELNNFFARFEAHSPDPVGLPAAQWTPDAVDLQVTEADVSETFSRVNGRKAAGPDGIPSRVLKTCYVQLAPVFTTIFNLSLSLCVVPRVFKETIIVPVPKKTPISCLNDYRPVALTSVIMKCLERLVISYVKRNISATLDPLQFAYCANRSADDAISLALHTALVHLENRNAYVRMLFIDYSSAFNTIVPSKLVLKLRGLGLGNSICDWLFDFLTGRPQTVRIGKALSSTIVLRTGAPQGCCLSPLLYSLFTHDCAARFDNNSIIKFADDTTVIGLISNNDEMAYRREVENLSLWCHDNNLSLNVNKTKEIIVDFRIKRPDHTPIIIDGASVEIVDSFRFLGTHISDTLTWSLNTKSILKKAQQRLYFLRRLKKFGLSTKALVNFYRCIIESVLTFTITVWYGSMTSQDCKQLKRVVKTAAKIINTDLPQLHDIYTTRCKKRAYNIIRDPSHPAHALFSPLPSGKRYRSIKTRTTRLSNSFFPQAVRLLNG